MRFLGLDLFSLHIATESPEPAQSDDDPGDCTSYPVGFVSAHEIPNEAGPYREGWE